MKIRKLRLYFETTTFNYFFDEEREGHKDVVKLFESVKAGEFEGYTSDYVIDELKKAEEPKSSNMMALIVKYGLTVLHKKAEVENLSELYISHGIIPTSHIYDSLHVALASVYKLERIISYNFQHINRNKTKNQTVIVNEAEGYGEVIIVTAKEVLEDEETERRTL